MTGRGEARKLIFFPNKRCNSTHETHRMVTFEDCYPKRSLKRGSAFIAIPLSVDRLLIRVAATEGLSIFQLASNWTGMPPPPYGVN